MAGLYPLSVRDDRVFPEGYSGPVYVWDIDKTYLATRFSSWRGLARVPVEFSIDKQAIPGMPEILRGLRRGTGKGVACLPLYFISASPPFLRSSIEGKMLMDGVEHDGITFKDWLRTLLELKPGRLFEQLGFKLAALLSGRLRRPHAREYLFGDDYERDPEAFSLYARCLREKFGPEVLREELESSGVSETDRGILLDMAGRLPKSHGGVKKIYIHLEHGSDPKSFKKFGPDLVPVRGAWQLALALWQEGLVDLATVRAARAAVTAVPRYRFGKIPELSRDALARKVVSGKKFRRIGER